MSDNYSQLKEIFGERIKENEPMANHTTFKIGGPARFYFEAQTIDEIIRAVELCQKLDLPYFILGGGSNLLVSDQGYQGLVIKNKSNKIKLLGYQGKIENLKSQINKLFIEVESGVLTNSLVRYTLKEGFSGLEDFLGIPGSVGGAIYINAHYRDHFIGDCLEKAKILTKDGKVKEVENTYFRFAYDQSILQKTGEILLSVIFRLTGGDKDILWQKAQTSLEWRQKNHHYDLPSAGCIFRNIQKSEALRLGTPDSTQSVGFLIEAAGFKGTVEGGAQISKNHANFIVNLGGARAADVVRLINSVKAKVKEKFGINLKEEIVYLGEF